uniref:Uncharacterized protein n=1 Tax=Lepeophtheirus salmonis TaxID=72036 RepID=A0A0K2U362_LEPSM
MMPLNVYPNNRSRFYGLQKPSCLLFTEDLTCTRQEIRLVVTAGSSKNISMPETVNKRTKKQHVLGLHYDI